MGLLDKFIGKKTESESLINTKEESGTPQPKSNVIMFGANVFTPINPIYKKVWDGEKTTGQLGAVIDVVPDHRRLSLRSLEAYAKTDLIKILTDRKLQWVIGTGLKLEVEPNKDVLSMFDISIPDSFYKRVEGLWKVYMNSKHVDYCGKMNLADIAWIVEKAASLSGDCLVICRIEDNFTVQIISGQFVQTPDLTSGDYKLPENHTIENGVEINERGEHVAYFVEKRYKKDDVGINPAFERVEAVGRKTKKRLAWMVYANQLSHDHTRGVPDSMQVIEKVNKLDRFNEAEVAGAEQRANIVFSIEHDASSTGEDIMTEFARRSIPGLGVDTGEGETSPYVLADASAQRIAEATESTAINMPIGAKLKTLASDKEAQFATFDEANSKKISASMGTPLEVAYHSYNSNYSASRAAINGYGHIVDIDQTKFTRQFYQPIYQLWFDYMVKSNIIQAPGYLIAESDNNVYVLEAYTTTRFVGKKMPHIDPLKETNAVRRMLGDKTKGEIPLISNEQASEMLNAGDWNENIEEYAEELNNNALKQINDATTTTTENPVSGMEQ